jgi:hypothetical protein
MYTVIMELDTKPVLSKAKREKLQVKLADYARTFLSEAYGMTLDIPLKINGRLKKTLGWFEVRKTQFIDGSIERKALDIEISAQYVTLAALDGQRGIENLLSTVRHECIHYALFSQGRPYGDGEAEFESELRKHNTGSTNTKGYTLSYIDRAGEEWAWNEWDKDKVEVRVKYVENK